MIDERNDDNNVIEYEYEYYQYQENFPVLVDFHINSIPNNIPLINNESIILGSKRISFSGEIIWDSMLNTKGLALPVPSSENEFDYILKVITTSNNKLHRVDGNMGTIQLSYFAYSNRENYHLHCLGDLNNDGENELIGYYTIGLDEENRLAIFNLNGDLLLDENCDEIVDIAVGDYDCNGKNELYILSNNSLSCYDYNDGVINYLGGHTFTHSNNKNLAFDDFNNDGELDCAVFSSSKIDFINCSNLATINESIALSSGFKKYALGDIDNDGVTEIVIIQYSNGISTIYKIDILDLVYSDLFNVSDIDNLNCNLTLYDLNADNILDIIIRDSHHILCYSIDGNLIIDFPGNFSSCITIADIDNDNDIEFLLGNISSDFSQCNVIASDLTIPVSNHGNVYPKVNEYNNNLYSQPVSGLLSENTTYHWNGSISLHGEVILPGNSNIIIQTGTIIYAGANSKLICNGDLSVTGTESLPVIFQPDIYGASENYWQGLEFPNSTADISLNHTIIKNAQITSENNLEITGGELINTPISQSQKSLWLNEVELENSPIAMNAYGLLQGTELISINNCHIFNAFANPGVEITGYPNINISYNLIENCFAGIKLWESGSGMINSVSNNLIRNNTRDYGLFLYHSNINILGHNRIENNREGIFILRDSNFDLIGSEDYPLQVVKNNIQNEIQFTYDSRPGQFYYNKIFDNNHDYCYVKCINVPTIYSPIDITYNCWGTSFDPNIDLSPLNIFRYLPVWDPGVPKNSVVSEDEEIYLSAIQSIDNQDYSEAEQSFMQLITIYPESKYAKIAAKELFDLKVKYDQDFASLKLYYENEPNMMYDEEMIKLRSFLITKCNLKLEEFQIAIDFYEEIIENPPSAIDSVCAVIDAGYAYLLMENSGRGNYVG